jgi:membrane protease YdiL (CAAX protease family)
MLVAIGSERFISPQSPFVLHVLAIGVYVAIVASVLFIVFHYEHQSLPSLGIRPFRRQTVVWGLLLAAFFMYVYAPGAYWALARFNLSGFEAGMGKTVGLPLWYLAISVIFGGISEELLYRGYAIERIATLTGSYWLAGAISAGIFGLAHVPVWGWGPALITVVSGAVAAAF